MRKRKQPSKKIRTWYRLYRQRQKTFGIAPLSLRIWAALEVDSCETGSAREKELLRFVGPAPAANDY